MQKMKKNNPKTGKSNGIQRLNGFRSETYLQSNLVPLIQKGIVS